MTPIKILDLHDYALLAHAHYCAAGGVRQGHAQQQLAADYSGLFCPLPYGLPAIRTVADTLPFALPINGRVIDAKRTLSTRRAHADKPGFAALERGELVAVVEVRRGPGPSGLELRAQATETWLDFLLWEFRYAPGIH